MSSTSDYTQAYQTEEGGGEGFLHGTILVESDTRNLHHYLHRLCRLLFCQLLLTSFTMHTILWFELIVMDYSDSWLLFISIMLNLVFSMSGVWLFRTSLWKSTGFIILFTLIWSYFLNLQYWCLEFLDPMRGCYITTLVIGCIALFTMQERFSMADRKTLYWIPLAFIISAGLVHLIYPYYSISRFFGAVISASASLLYLLTGVMRSTFYISSGTEPTPSFMVVVAMLHPFFKFQDIENTDFGTFTLF